MNNKHFIIVGIILAVVAILSIISYLPARQDAGLGVRVANFPLTIGDWQGKDLPIDDLTYKILETRNLFIREYSRPNGDKVYFYIVYSEDNRKVSHPPEVCLLGSGITIANKASINIAEKVRATELLVEKAKNQEMVVYWFKAGALQTDKYLKQQFKIVLDRMIGKRTSGALLRMTTVIKDNNRKAAQELLKSFCAEIQPILPQYIP